MLKYLIIPLADDAVSFCHYERAPEAGKLIPADILREAIRWSMKENLNVQFVYPDRELPQEYHRLIDSIDHTSIVSTACEDKVSLEDAEVVVVDSWAALDDPAPDAGKSYVLRTSKDDFFDKEAVLQSLLRKVDRLVVVITDIDKFSEADFKKYEKALDSLIPVVAAEYEKGHTVQFNLLTDRMFLDKMNNCNAGYESITLGPDGKFYICPAFYLDGSEPVGDLETGPEIKNSRLYRIDHAPICRVCDAFQCRRCVWLNRNTTFEVNTPSHEQCVVAHIERNASRKLLETIRKAGRFMPETDIPVIDYLDPFDKLMK